MWEVITLREVDGIIFYYLGRFYLESLTVIAAIFWSPWPTSITFFLAKTAFFSGLRVRKPGELILKSSSFYEKEKFANFCSRIFITDEMIKKGWK